MPSVIDIELSVDQGDPIEVELNYSATPPVNIVLSEPEAPVIEISFANIGPKGDQGDPGTGGGGDLSDFLFGEVPIGVIDGSNATFTTPFDFVAGKVEVFLNGLLQKLVTHYQTIGTNQIQFNDSPQIGDQILINQIKL